MTPEETIRNLINRSGPRKGTGRILTEYYGPSIPVQSQPKEQPKTETGELSTFDYLFNAEKRREKAREDYRKADQAKLDQARAEQNKTTQEQPPTSTPAPTSSVKSDSAQVPSTPPATQAKDTNVQTPQGGSAETPEQKAESDAKETESSVPNPRAAGGGLQIGSSLNTSNLQATQQRFIRGSLNNSYDPFDARKSFIREFVIRIVETKEVPEKAIDRARRKQEEKKHERERARFKTGLQTGEVVAPPRITLEPRSIMDLFKNPL